MSSTKRRPWAALASGSAAKTVEVTSLGSYRVVAAVDRSGRTVISGLPIESVTETVAQVVTLVTGGDDR